MSNICTSYEQRCVLNPRKTMYIDGEWMYIHALSAEEVMTQYGLVSYEKIRLCVYTDNESMFLDSEGSAELCRLLHVEQKVHCREGLVVPVLPCDYSICMLASKLEIECVEITLGHPLLEHGIMRPKILQQILNEIKTKVVAGGTFNHEEVQQLMDWGCVGVHQYKRDLT